MELKDAIKYINNAPQKIAKAAASAPKMIEKGAKQLADLPRETYKRADRGVHQVASQMNQQKAMAIKNGYFVKSQPLPPKRDAIGPEAQVKGEYQRTTTERKYHNEETANATFRRQSEALLRPDGWNSNLIGFTDADAPTWHLLDANGKEAQKSRRIEKGDVLRIDAPGPDFFVQADRVNVAKDNVQFTVRPCADPANPKAAPTKHFFTDASTRTFQIQKDGSEVRFVTTGNNEKTNVSQSGGIKNAAFNIAVSTAIVGGGDDFGGGELYWNSFGDGLMER